MGKIYVQHRIVVRDQNDRIVIDESHESFTAAKPAFDQIVVRPGQSVTLQHGARIIAKREG
ncbi:hypothetical protein [uncultured Thioclava sp.]|uniref:hypothetical protein n=1 Tax=uncultured Thioclava sp. TaxID=473858 RepID=UPI0025DDA408|nr:hypothetical protein [uncultured Thioclava sp.]